MEYSTMFLSVLAVLLVNLVFITAILQNGLEARLMLLHLAVVLFYSALYFRRRLRHRRAGLHRGLGYTAVVLGAFLSALFFYSFAPAGVPLSLAIGVWIVLSVAAYFLYRVIVLHLEDEVAVQAQVVEGPPV